jgi:hypothetical protein
VRIAESFESKRHQETSAFGYYVCTLRLENDAVVDDDTVLLFKERKHTFLGSNVDRTVALLDFYQHLHSLSKKAEDRYMAKVLSLLDVCDVSMCNNQQDGRLYENVVLLIGESQSGKSGCINSMAGTRYVIVEEGIDVFLEVDDNEGNVPELTTTKNLYESNTLCPMLLGASVRGNVINVLSGVTMLDTAGFSDTRGLAVRIASGIALQALNGRVSSYGLIVIVVVFADLVDKTLRDLQKSFEAAGKLIRLDMNMMQNVVLVVNKTPANKMSVDLVVGQLNRIKERISEWSEPALHILKNLKHENVHVVHIPDQQLSNFVAMTMNKAASIQNGHLDFAHFLEDTNDFENVVGSLETYLRKQEASLEDLIVEVFDLQLDLVRTLVLNTQ